MHINIYVDRVDSVDIGVVSTDHAEEEEDDLDWADDGVDDEAAAVVADHPLLDAPQQLAQRVVGVLLGECLPPEGVGHIGTKLCQDCAELPTSRRR